jgi:hypothetical protein
MTEACVSRSNKRFVASVGRQCLLALAYELVLLITVQHAQHSAKSHHTVLATQIVIELHNYTVLTVCSK